MPRETIRVASVADGTTPAKKPTRQVGPRDVYILFKPNVDPTLVSQMRDSISSVTMNGRALLKHLQGGNASQFLTYKVVPESRNKE